MIVSLFWWKLTFQILYVKQLQLDVMLVPAFRQCFTSLFCPICIATLWHYDYDICWFRRRESNHSEKRSRKNVNGNLTTLTGFLLMLLHSWVSLVLAVQRNQSSVYLLWLFTCGCSPVAAYLWLFTCGCFPVVVYLWFSYESSFNCCRLINAIVAAPIRSKMNTRHVRLLNCWIVLRNVIGTMIIYWGPVF